MINVMCRKSLKQNIVHIARDKIFDKFFSLQRPGTGKKSTGLGLNFVREVAALHHGEITLENREPGGTRAKLVFLYKLTFSNHMKHTIWKADYHHFPGISQPASNFHCNAQRYRRHWLQCRRSGRVQQLENQMSGAACTGQDSA